MNSKEFKKVGRREVSEKDLTDAMKAMLDTPPIGVSTRTPTRKELNEKHRLDRIKK